VNNSPARILALDGLRGVAIALVLIHHFVVPLLGNILGSPGAYLAAALTLSYTGVDLFFVLSGYLIGGILLDHRDSPQLFTTFYLRRAVRILPICLLCIVTILGAQADGLYGPPQGSRPWPAAVYFLFSTNLWMAAVGDWGYRPLSHLWSLGIEEQFYLGAPWLIRWIRPERIGILLLGFILFAPCVRLALLAAGENSFTVAMLPFDRMDALGFGLLSAWGMRNPILRMWCERRPNLLPSLMGIAAVGCMALTKLRAGNGSLPMSAWGYTVMAVFYSSWLLLCETHPASKLCQLLSTTPLVLLGRWSYFIYLFQGLIIGIVVSLVFRGHLAIGAPTTWLQLVVGLAGLLVVAAASWRWFETPFIAWGRRWCY
jgi:peptidoglycan/LPS O-acetylase OafA/YrhL